METGIKAKQGLTSGKVYYLVLCFCKNPDFFQVTVALKLVFY